MRKCIAVDCHRFCSGKRSEGYALGGSSRKYHTREGTETSSAQNLISLSNLETDEQREQLGAQGDGAGGGGDVCVCVWGGSSVLR